MLKKVVKVKAGYEELHCDLVAKLENIELEAMAKVEAMIADDKKILNDMLAIITYEEEVEETEEPEETESTPEYSAENF